MHRPQCSTEFSLGERVHCEEFGTGFIIGRWGPFQGCPECTKLVVGDGKTPCCDRPPIAVTGHGIYDVQFRFGMRSVNQCWLKKPEPTP